MVVSGIPKPNGIRHAREVCQMSLDVRDASRSFVIPHMPGEALKIRIGVHSGEQWRSFSLQVSSGVHGDSDSQS